MIATVKMTTTVDSKEVDFIKLIIVGDAIGCSGSFFLFLFRCLPLVLVPLDPILRQREIGLLLCRTDHKT